MAYPKKVCEILIREGMLPAMAACEASSIHVDSTSIASCVDYTIVNKWVLENRSSYSEVNKWLHFLTKTRKRFAVVQEQMGYWNNDSSHSLGHDKWSVGWAGDVLMPIANYMYLLRSWGVEGDLLECGAFKGSSTACLSLVCKDLDFHLFCADSFEGLPSEEGHYDKGDFIGSLDEVKHNVGKFGASDDVTYIPGWYSDSLKEFPHSLALLWVDVDLQASTMDLLSNVYGKISPNGVIFSDGFSEGVDYDGEKIRKTGGEPAGFYRFFNESKLDYKTVPGGSKGLALIIPECRENETIRYDGRAFMELLHQL